MWTESSSVAGGSPCCHCRPSRSCSKRLATGSEQRWSPRCWVGGRCLGARFDSVWSRRTGQDITVSDIAAAAFVTVRAVQLPRQDLGTYQEDGEGASAPF